MLKDEEGNRRTVALDDLKTEVAQADEGPLADRRGDA
jgi:hypothetical protein